MHSASSRIFSHLGDFFMSQKLFETMMLHNMRHQSKLSLAVRTIEDDCSQLKYVELYLFVASFSPPPRKG